MARDNRRPVMKRAAYVRFCRMRGGRETKKDRVRDPVKEPAQSGKKCGRSGLVAGPVSAPDPVSGWHHPGVNAGYSRSSAWMGSSLAARRAGAKPNITPIRLAQRQATPMVARE